MVHVQCIMLHPRETFLKQPLLIKYITVSTVKCQNVHTSWDKEILQFHVRFCQQMNNEKLVFYSLLDFRIEVKGLWTSVDKTYIMTRTITRKNTVNQSNFKAMGLKNSIRQKLLPYCIKIKVFCFFHVTILLICASMHFSLSAKNTF